MNQPVQIEQPNLIDKPLQQFGYVTEEGKPILEAPQASHLLRIASNPRITYFPFRIAGKPTSTIDIGMGEPLMVRSKPTIPYVTNEKIVVSNDDLAGMRKVLPQIGAGGLLFGPTLDSLAVQIAADFPNQQIALRGTCCSLDTSIQIPYGDNKILTVKDIQTVMDDGTDRNNNSSGVTGFDQNNPEINYKSREWLIQTSQETRQSLEGQPVAENIFPVILVYDQTTHPLGYYATPLPDSPEERSRIILKAYVLDFPHK